jgi:hypothetical protein
MKPKKIYTYFSPSHEAKRFPSLEAMREFAQDPAHVGDYYIGVPATQRSYHRNRENMLNTFDDSHDT